MAGKIISRYLNLGRYGSKLSKWLGSYLATASILLPIVLGMGGGWNLSKPANKARDVAVKVIAKNNPAAFNSASDFLKKDPNLVGNFLENYEGMQRLNSVFFERESSLEGKLILESSGRVVFSGEPFFSSQEIHEDSFYAHALKMIYDPSNKELYELNKEQQTLEKSFGRVECVVSFPKSAYFVHEKNVFSKNEDGRIKKLSNAEREYKLRAIHGIEACAVFGDGKLCSAEVSEANEEFKQKITQFAKKLCGDKFKFNENVKFVYDSEKDALYMSNGKKLYGISNSTTWTKEFEKDIYDFVLTDVNGDGAKELAVLSGEKESKQIEVFSRNNKGFYRKGRAYSVQSDGSAERLIESSNGEYAGLNPDKFKERVNKVLERNISILR